MCGWLSPAWCASACFPSSRPEQCGGRWTPTPGPPGLCWSSPGATERRKHKRGGHIHMLTDSPGGCWITVSPITSKLSRLCLRVLIKLEISSFLRASVWVILRNDSCTKRKDIHSTLLKPKSDSLRAMKQRLYKLTNIHVHLPAGLQPSTPPARFPPPP